MAALLDRMSAATRDRAVSQEADEARTAGGLDAPSRMRRAESTSAWAAMTFASPRRRC